MRLSVSIVCKNSADTIGRTLDSVQGLADEIVAVDSGSTDATLDMLREAGARVIESPWLGYVKTKQLALDHCQGDWVLALDSDESPLPELIRSIESALTNPGKHTGFLVNRKVYVHINNSNPVLDENSNARRQAETSGWEIGFDGMEIRI